MNFRTDHYEKIAIVIFCLAIFYLRVAQPFDGKISHNYPVFYTANDAFQDMLLAYHTEKSGSPLYDPQHIAFGFSETLNRTPPLIFIYSAMFSLLSGIPLYDLIYIIVIIFSLAAMLTMYLIIRRQSINLALLSLPFMLGIYNFSFELIYPFGIWNFVIGSAFGLGALWVIDNFERKYSAILLGLMLAASALSHTVQTIFVTLLIAAYLIIKWIKGKETKAIASKIAVAYAITLALSAYYLNIFRIIIQDKSMKLFTVAADFNMAPGRGVSLWHFEHTLLFFILGIALLGISYAGRKNGDNSILNTLELSGKGRFFLFIAAAFLIIGYTNYIGFSERAWQVRTFWPIYLSPIFAVGVLFLIKKIRRDISTASIAAISIVLLLFFASLHMGKFSPQGVMDEGTWDGMQWIQNNTLTNDKIFYFYTPLLFTSQAIPFTGRMTYYVNFDDFVDGIKGSAIKSNYLYSLANEGNSGVHFTTGFGFERRTPGELQQIQEPGYLNMDYYIFTISALGDHPALIQYNLAIKDAFLSRNMTEVYNNGRISILKNNRVSK